MGAQEVITPFRAVTANDIDFGIGTADGSSEIGKNVEDSRIVVLDVASAVIAEEMIELRLGFRKIDIATTIDHINVLAGVSVIEAKVVFLI